MSPYSSRRLLRITTALLIAAPGTALSQSAPLSEDDLYLGTIVLGESKREVATETAIPTTTIDATEIKDRQAGTIAELIDSVPGVTLVNGATAAGSGINIRGYGANGTFGTDQKVLIQVDGATKGSEELYRIGTQLYTDPFLFREVEVIRGTIGSFEYGSGVFGGVVRLETINASDILGDRLGFGGRQTFEFSSNGDGLTSSTILGWQPDENLELLFNYTRRTLGVRSDGDGNDINPAAGDLDDPSYLFKGRYTFGADRAHSLTFSYSNTEQEQFDVPYDTFGLANFGNVDRFIENEVASLRYNYNPVGNDLINLDVELTYSDELVESQAIDRSLPIFTLNLLDADNRYQTTTLRIRNTALFETGPVQHTLRTGAEYILRERQDASAGAAPGGEKEVFALYAVNDMQIGGAWTITPALRFETQTITEDPVNGVAEFGDDALMGGLSVRYAFDNGIALFGSAAYTVNLPIVDDISSDLIFQSERATTYEAGISYEALDVFDAGDTLAVKLNYYTQTSDSVTTLRAMGNPLESVDQVDRDGFELEASYARQSGLYIDLNAHISEGDETLLNGTVQDYRFNPADSLRLTLGQRLGDQWDLSYELVAQRRYDEGTDISPGFGVSNLRATYIPQRGLWEGTEIRFGIENVFDKLYQPRLSTRNATGRNFILTLAATF
ncbi:TonB-dependent receptor domain-containing protein [Roseobacter sinensis]|uniref:TonB-dependent receptor n=1 Tax=Roseobacter sinensis TaxID=2931391 RepID=A0ABT3BKA0_9RHOB|nr:TonB-dependent receptor [Roseobacter sp. WL0113]MCV3274007.1 TonB-dependent receptor [Roseobacter sp. WL0113]